MAQTTIASPQTKTPAYNPIKFGVPVLNILNAAFKSAESEEETEDVQS